MLHVGRGGPDGGDRDGRCGGDGAAVDAGGDGREGDGGGAGFVGSGEAGAVAGGEHVGLAVGAASPDGADGVDHVHGRQAESGRDLGVAGVAAARQPAGVQQIGAGSAMGGAVDSAATEQGGVRGVDDGIDALEGDVADDHLQRRVGRRRGGVDDDGAPAFLHRHPALVEDEVEQSFEPVGLGDVIATPVLVGVTGDDGHGDAQAVAVIGRREGHLVDAEAGPAAMRVETFALHEHEPLVLHLHGPRAGRASAAP